jgi:hypothetical protein
MKLAILRVNKKKLIASVCVIAAFAGGAVVGAQIYANASNNAVAVLPIAKGGTNANTAATAANNILGSNYGNYGGILPLAKGGTGTALGNGTAGYKLTSNADGTSKWSNMGAPVTLVSNTTVAIGGNNNAKLRIYSDHTALLTFYYTKPGWSGFGTKTNVLPSGYTVVGQWSGLAVTQEGGGIIYAGVGGDEGSGNDNGTRSFSAWVQSNNPADGSFTCKVNSTSLI